MPSRCPAADPRQPRPSRLPVSYSDASGNTHVGLCLLQVPALPPHDPGWALEQGRGPLTSTLPVRGPYTLTAPPRPPADGQTPHLPGQELTTSWGPRAVHSTLDLLGVLLCAEAASSALDPVPLALELTCRSAGRPSPIRGRHRLPNSPRFTVSLSSSFSCAQGWGRRHSLSVCGRGLERGPQRSRRPQLQGLGLSPIRQK